MMQCSLDVWSLFICTLHSYQNVLDFTLFSVSNLFHSFLLLF